MATFSTDIAERGRDAAHAGKVIFREDTSRSVRQIALDRRSGPGDPVGQFQASASSDTIRSVAILPSRIVSQARRGIVLVDVSATR